MAFGLCAGSLGSLDGPIGHLKGSWGWWSDGSLRAHGEVVIPAGVRNLLQAIYPHLVVNYRKTSGRVAFVRRYIEACVACV